MINDEKFNESNDRINEIMNKRLDGTMNYKNLNYVSLLILWQHIRCPQTVVCKLQTIVHGQLFVNCKQLSADGELGFLGWCSKPMFWNVNGQAQSYLSFRVQSLIPAFQLYVYGETLKHVRCLSSVLRNFIRCHTLTVILFSNLYALQHV